MGRISDKIRHLLARQVRGIVVWYDSEKAYGSLVKRLSFLRFDLVRSGQWSFCGHSCFGIKA